MAGSAIPARPHGRASMLGWRRVLVTLGVSILVALLLGLIWSGSLLTLVERAVIVGFSAMLAFATLERWPTRLPAWLPRWVLQVLGTALVVPLVMFVIFVTSTPRGTPPFWKVENELIHYML